MTSSAENCCDKLDVFEIVREYNYLLDPAYTLDKYFRYMYQEEIQDKTTSLSYEKWIHSWDHQTDLEIEFNAKRNAVKMAMKKVVEFYFPLGIYQNPDGSFSIDV